MFLKELYIKGFMPFAEEQRLIFPQNGVIMIRGINEVSASQSSNGAGKSSIIDAIAWCLFGKTCRGVRGNEVISKFGDGKCHVQLSIVSHNGEILVERKKPESYVRLTCGRDVFVNEDANRAIADVLGFGFNEFAYASFYSATVGSRFLELSSDQKLSLIDNILGIDFGRKFEAIKSAERALENELSGIKSRCSTLKDNIARLIAELNAKLAIQSCADDLSSKISELEKKRDSLHADLQNTISTLGNMEDVSSAISAASEKLNAIRRRYGDLLAKVSLTYVKRDGGQWSCKYCGAIVSDDLKLKELSRLDESIVSAKADEHRLMDELERLKKIKAQRDVVLQKKQRILSEINAVNLEIDNIKLKLENQSSVVAAIQKQIDELDGQLALCESDLRNIGNRYSIIQYLSEAYSVRGIRALAFMHVRDFLNASLKKNLAIIANSEIDAAFYIDLNKRSPITIDVFKNNMSFSIDCLSSGERRRLDFAISESLRELAMISSSHGFPVEVYDEPTDSLDDVGREMFCNLVKAKALSKPVIVITHSHELLSYLEPKMLLTVVRKHNGSSIYVS